MLFLNWREKRRHGGKRQDVLNRKEEMLRGLKSEQVLFPKTKKGKARMDVWDKSGCCDKIAQGGKRPEKGGMPMFLGSSLHLKV